MQHRSEIGVRAEAMLSQFWRDEDTSEAVRALEIEGWMDVLEHVTQREVREAWAEYQRSGPRTKAGKLYRPDPGAIYQLILKKRRLSALERKAQEPERPEPKREPRMSAETAQKIVDEAGFAAGFKVKRFGGGRE